MKPYDLLKKQKRKLKYLSIIGTTILLSSWIVEHYWTSYWTGELHKLNDARSELIQAEIHESVSTAMYQYTANIEPFQRRLVTTLDVTSLLSGFYEITKTTEAAYGNTKTNSPILMSSDVESIFMETLIAVFPKEYLQIVEGTLDKPLTADQQIAIYEIMAIMNQWVKAHQMFLAIDLLYDTAISRLARSEEIAKKLSDPGDFHNRFAAMRLELEQGRERFYETGILFDSTSNFKVKADRMRISFSEHVSNNISVIVDKEAKYKYWHRVLYIVGSLLLLLGMVAGQLMSEKSK